MGESYHEEEGHGASVPPEEQESPVQENESPQEEPEQEEEEGQQEIIDLDNLDTSGGEGVEIELHHPVSGKPLGIFFTVVGSDNSIYRQKAHEVNSRRVSMARSAQTKAEVQAAELSDWDTDGLELIVACVRSWRNVVKSGNPIACTTNNKREIIGRFRWIREQLDRAIHDRSNFLKP